MSNVPAQSVADQEAAFAQNVEIFEQHAAQLTMVIGTTLQKVLEGADPAIASTALIRFAGGVASQVSHFTREIITGELVNAFDKTREMMTNPPEGLRLALGLQPGEALPADFKERLARMAQERGLVPPAPAAGG